MQILESVNTTNHSTNGRSHLDTLVRSGCKSFSQPVLMNLFNSVVGRNWFSHTKFHSLPSRNRSPRRTTYKEFPFSSRNRARLPRITTTNTVIVHHGSTST